MTTRSMIAALAVVSAVGISLTGNADVTSSNVVGYQNKALNENANAFVCGTFLPIGVDKENVTLKDFVPMDGEKGWAYDTDFLATLKVNGNKEKEYGYLTPYFAKKYFDETQVGWYDLSICKDEEFDGAESRNDVKIPFGTGVLVYTAGANMAITFAGEVLSDDVAITLNENANTFTGNASPADIKLGDLEPTDGADGWAYDTDFLATLKTNGNKEHEYGYLSPYFADKYFDISQVGWYDLSICKDEEFDGAEKRDELPIPAGQSFMVYTAGAKVELVVPSPF